MSRKPLIAGNWKMNLNHFEAIALVQKIAFALPDKYYDKVDVTVLPPFTNLRSVQTLVDGDKLRLTYGAQDLSQHESGPYTGDISGTFLSKLGCSFVVVGHSERRTYHNEDDELVAAKATAALKNELTPIVCIGEHLEIREAGEHVSHCEKQLRRFAGRAVGRADRQGRHRLRAGLGDWNRTGRQCVRCSGGVRGDPEGVGVPRLARDRRNGAGALRRFGEREKRRRHRRPGGR